jgi:hypothetical protein
VFAVCVASTAAAAAPQTHVHTVQWQLEPRSRDEALMRVRGAPQATLNEPYAITVLVRNVSNDTKQLVLECATAAATAAAATAEAAAVSRRKSSARQTSSSSAPSNSSNSSGTVSSSVAKLGGLLPLDVAVPLGVLAAQGGEATVTLHFLPLRTGLLQLPQLWLRDATSSSTPVLRPNVQHQVFVVAPGDE